MKITPKILENIIKEEIANVLKEVIYGQKPTPLKKCLEGSGLTEKEYNNVATHAPAEVTAGGGSGCYIPSQVLKWYNKQNAVAKFAYKNIAKPFEE